MKLFPLFAILVMALAANSFAKQDETICEDAATNVVPFRLRSGKIVSSAVPEMQLFSKVILTAKDHELENFPRFNAGVYNLLEFFQVRNVPKELDHWVLVPKNESGARTLYTSRLEFQHLLESTDKPMEKHERLETLVRGLIFKLKIERDLALTISLMYYASLPEEGSRVAHLAFIVQRVLLDQHVQVNIYDYDGELMKWNNTPARR